MDYYGIDPQELALKRMLRQAEALRGSKAPQGQMVGSGQFQHYVAPSKLQSLSPLTGQIAGDLVENRALDQRTQQMDANQIELQKWMAQKPKDDDDVGLQNWAAIGLRNPATRQLAQKVLDDQVVNAPIRAEKAADRKSLLSMTNERYAEERKARSALAAQQSADRLARLELQLNNSNIQQNQRLQVQQEIAREQIRMRQYQIDAGIERADKDRDSRERLAADRLAQQAAGAGKLSSTQQGKLEALKDQYVEMKQVVDSFKDEYSGGYAVLKNTAAPYGGIIPKAIYNAAKPENLDLTDWWRSYNKIGNFERHELFGSALTKIEQEAWKKQALPDTATPEQVRRSNEARMKILEGALERRGAGDWLGIGDLNAPAPKPSVLPRTTSRSSAGRVESPVGNFKGSPEQILDDIATIKDPVERDNARRAYTEQATRGGGGSPKKLSDEELLNKYRSK